MFLVNLLKCKFRTPHTIVDSLFHPKVPLKILLFFIIYLVYSLWFLWTRLFNLWDPRGASNIPQPVLRRWNSKLKGWWPSVWPTNVVSLHSAYRLILSQAKPKKRLPNRFKHHFYIPLVSPTRPKEISFVSFLQEFTDDTIHTIYSVNVITFKSQMVLRVHPPIHNQPIISYFFLYSAVTSCAFFLRAFVVSTMTLHKIPWWLF